LSKVKNCNAVISQLYCFVGSNFALTLKT